MRALSLVALLLLGACATTHMGEHPLAGRVWDVRHERFIEPEQAEALVARADYALLGETHDNAVHHQIQLRLLRRAAEAPVKPALAMEQVDRDTGQMPPSWNRPLYEPLFAFARDNALRVIPANFSRTASRPVMSGGLAALPQPERERLGVDPVWTPARNATLRSLIVEGHCGQDDPVVDSIVVVQRVRDAVMADAILEAPHTVAIIGRGHARADVGVPLYLAQRAPGKHVVSLGMVEAESGKDRPQDYADAAPGVHDFVWFTPRAGRADPCAAFKAIRRTGG